MPVTVDCFLDIAKRSLENNGEQWSRNAISRAYYTMYHSAIRLTDGFTPTVNEHGEKLSGGVHVRLAEYLCSGHAASQHGLDTIATKKIGLKLKTAHHRRVISDYNLNKQVNRIDAFSTIKDAEDMTITINSMLSAKKTAS